MNPNFCEGCGQSSNLPECAVKLAPNNSYIEDMINGTALSYSENFVCHKAAQDFSDGRLSIQSSCDDCGLCYILCPYVNNDATAFFSGNLEKVLFHDLGKAGILFQSLFPHSLVATKVQVKGNSRTKRIDLVIKIDTAFYLIKLLKNLDKIPFYTRSYNEVMELYSSEYPRYTFKTICLIPRAKVSNVPAVSAEVCDLSGLYHIVSLHGI